MRPHLLSFERARGLAPSSSPLLAPQGREKLFSFEHAWTDAAFDAIHPHGTALGAGVESLHPARFFDQAVGMVPFEQSVGLRLTLWLIALAPLFTIRKLGTIASIAPADRVRVLERLLASPIYAVRQLTLSFKAMAALLYSQSDDVRMRMNKPRAKLVSIGKKKMDGGRHEHAAE